ncbi:pyrrolidone-carboxylate peptidase [Panicum miliaceum]|uniref:Pyrrolidone-carboxylate peptidase n=1 Tax=Panicum miliaceum TaxID=4540 RepID=A0A3L6R3X3_PANMI|nr:pyrrolidone-carboxylate peptidase [Panicum miliaceum]
MGSEGPSVVTVHVTGFKKFIGVPENPTEKIVSNLQSYMEKKGLPKSVVRGSCTVLEVAGQGALGTLYEVLESAISDRKEGSQIIWIHFGVSGGLPRFALENQAVNDATFACPDELGWKPQRVPIVPSDGNISQIRKTTLPVNELVKMLRKIGHDVMRSDDADRFVCNYVYYHSLRFAEEHGIKSLFVHVPLFSTIDEAVQMHFVASLLEAVASLN